MKRQDLIELFDGEPNFARIEAAGHNIAWELGKGHVVGTDYQPGDGTRYELVFTPLRGMRLIDGEVCSGMKSAAFGYPFGSALVSIVNSGGCYPLAFARAPGTVDPFYVREHWKVSLASAAALALLFEAIAERVDVPL